MDETTQADNAVELQEQTTPEVPDQAESTDAESMPNSQNSEEDLELPEGVKDRTREQFEKLKAQLAEEKKKNKQTQRPQGSMFDEFRHQPSTFNNLNQNQVNQIQESYIDQDGNVDVVGLNQALHLANQRAEQAYREAQETRARMIRVEEDKQAAEAHAKYPSLDPQSEDFDSNFYDLVRDRMLRNFYEGKEQQYIQVANDLARIYYPKTSKEAEKQAIEKAKQVQSQKQSGPIESGRGEQRETQANLDELRLRSRTGDKSAILQRLKAIGI